MKTFARASVSPTVTPERCAAPARLDSHQTPPMAVAQHTGQAFGSRRQPRNPRTGRPENLVGRSARLAHTVTQAGPFGILGIAGTAVTVESHANGWFVLRADGNPNVCWKTRRAGFQVLS